MFSKATLATLVATLAAKAMSLPLEQRDNAVKVELKQISDTEVEAVVTNTLAEEISLLNYGTFFDDDKVQKLTVSQDGAEVQFTGILKNYLLTDIPSEAFTVLAPGTSKSTTINIPAVHEINGGEYSVISQGAIPYAKSGSTALEGAAAFASNTITVNIDQAVAAAVPAAFNPEKRSIDKRTTVQNCAGTQSTALRTALSNAARLASAAATAATSGSATKFNEYFKSTSTTVRSTVAARLRGVVTQSSTTSTGTTYSCTDDYGVCTSGVLAYTYPSLNHIANCPLYYSALPALTSTCHAQDQATTSLHEFTHAPATYSPGTNDNAYGYSASTSLSSSAAVNNADSYALYSNAIYVGC